MDKFRISAETGRCRMGRRVVASYCSSFLKPEMLHIYRQVKALRGVDTFVVTKEVQNAERFPFEDIEIIPKRRTNLLVHGWLKFVVRRPPIVYRGEYQTLDSLLERHGADLMHIYFGHTGVHLLPFIEQWDKPCVVSFHGADVAHKPEIKDYPGKLRRLFNAVPLVFARSQSLADRLIHLGCPPEKLRINRTGIPLSEFPFVDREPPRDGKWRVVQACRLIPKKGIATSLRAFAIFKIRRISVATEAPGPLCQFACVFASERNISKPRPGRCAELGFGSDGHWTASGRDTSWWNSGSG